MTDSDDDLLSRAMEAMAEFDRQEAAIEAALSDAPDAEPLGLPESRQAEIVRAAVAHAAEPEPEPAIPIEGGSRPQPWRRAMLGIVGLAAVLALVWTLGRSGAEPRELGPLQLQLGGTARTLGPPDGAPRRYGAGDDFVLRVRPEGWSLGDVPIRVSAFPDSDAAPRRLELSRTSASDGAAEFRGAIANVLPAGRWTLRAEVGLPEDCDRRATSCRVLETEIDVVGD